MRTCFLVVGQQLFGGRDFLFARAHVVVEAHQVPVEIERRRDGGDHLLLELQIADFQIVLLHADIAPVDGGAETVQQVLRDLQIEIAVGVRVQAEVTAVEPGMRAGIRELRIKAEDKILRVDRLVGADILDQRGGSRNDGVALRNAQVLEIGERGDGGVERRNGGSQLRHDAAAGTDAGPRSPRPRRWC